MSLKLPEDPTWTPTAYPVNEVDCEAMRIYMRLKGDCAARSEVFARRIVEESLPWLSAGFTHKDLVVDVNDPLFPKVYPNANMVSDNNL